MSFARTGRPSTLFLRQDLLMAWSSPIRPGWLAHELQVSAYLCLPEVGLQAHTTKLLTWVLEIELGSSFSGVGKILYLLLHLSSLHFISMISQACKA